MDSITSIAERIDFFHYVNFLDDEQRDNLNAFIEELKKRWNITLTEDNGALLVIRLVFLCKKSKEKDKLDESYSFLPIYGNFENENEYKDACDIYDFLEKSLKLSIEKKEKEELIFYFLSLLRQKTLKEDEKSI